MHFYGAELIVDPNILNSMLMGYHAKYHAKVVSLIQAQGPRIFN